MSLPTEFGLGPVQFVGCTRAGLWSAAACCRFSSGQLAGRGLGAFPKVREQARGQGERQQAAALQSAYGAGYFLRFTSFTLSASDRCRQRCSDRPYPSLGGTSRNAGPASRPPTPGRLLTDWSQEVGGGFAVDRE
jgi:hypothetical protein